MATATVRRAQVSDVEEVTRLRHVMFQEMDVDAKDETWRGPTTEYLTRHLPLATVIGAVMDRPLEQGLCAAGLLRIQEVPGSPLFPRGMVGHIVSVAVDPQWRRQGIGEAIVTFLIDEARGRGLERLELHATPGGEGIYRRLGFRDRRAQSRPLRCPRHASNGVAPRRFGTVHHQCRRRTTKARPRGSDGVRER